MSQPESEPIVLPPPKRGCRTAVIGLLALGVLALVGLLIGWLVVRSTTNSRFAKAVAVADRQDPGGWRLAELEANRFQPPTGANPADRVMEVVALLPPNPFKPSGEGSASDDQEEPVLLIGDVLERLGEGPSNRRLDEKSRAALSSGLDELREALDVAHPLAETGEGRFPLQYAFNPINTLLPDIQNSRDVARLLKLDSAWHALDGDLAGALESVRATLGVARAIGDEPILISQLVRMAIGGVALESTEFVLGQGEASDDALAAVQEQFATEAAQPIILQAMKGERAMNSDLIEKLESGQLDIGSLSGPGSGPRGRGVFYNPAGRLFFRHNRALMLELMNQACEIAALPVQEQRVRWQALERQMESDRETRIKQLAGTLVYLLAPAISSAGEAEIRRVSQLNSMIVLLAAERHRITQGDWPKSVDALKPFLPGGRIPIDPYANQPILIRRVEDGFLAYSTSLDRTDDGGQIDDIRRYQDPGQDLGFRLWDVDHRGLPADAKPVEEAMP
jgi:hypothetical protein